MATYDRTVTGGGTVGHPGVVQRPYVITSPVYDAVDNTSLAGDDVVKLIDLPADTVVIGGALEVLAAGAAVGRVLAGSLPAQRGRADVHVVDACTLLPGSACGEDEHVLARRTHPARARSGALHLTSHARRARHVQDARRLARRRLGSGHGCRNVGGAESVADQALPQYRPRRQRFRRQKRI